MVGIHERVGTLKGLFSLWSQEWLKSAFVVLRRRRDVILNFSNVTKDHEYSFEM